MLNHILRPFSYLTIEHPNKWVVDWIYPLIIASISTLLIFTIRQFGVVPLYGDSGLIERILGFIQSLPGFFIAALAAIATFNRHDIDRTMPAPAPKLDITIRGKTVAIELTRRRFLCSMFAFLTAENLILIVLGIFSNSFYLPIKEAINTELQMWISGGFLFIFLFMFWQLFITSFWGLFYLGDKLHQPDA